MNTQAQRTIGALTLAHVANDINQSALPALLPFLIPARDLSLSAAALLVLAMNLSASLVQPLVGHLSDRRSWSPLVPASLLLSGLGACLVGVLSDYHAMLAACVVSGVGGAAFHPEASRRVSRLSGSGRAAGMSWFTLGGYLGFALGPVLVTPLVLIFGLPGTVWLAVPALLAATGIAWEQHRHPEAGLCSQGGVQKRQDNWAAFGWLSLVVGLRAVVFFGAVTFLPLYFMRVLQRPASLGNSALTALLLAGAVGTLAGGRLADRLPRTLVISVSLASTSLMALLLVPSGILRWSSLAFSLSFLMGLTISLSASVLVVLGQEYLPNHLGVASGVTLGLAVSMGGLAAPLFGALGDRFGLGWVFAAMALVGVLSWLTSLRLPSVYKPVTPRLSS